MAQKSKVSDAISHVKKRKKSAHDSLPADEAENPMAPALSTKTKRQKVKQVRFVFSIIRTNLLYYLSTATLSSHAAD